MEKEELRAQVRTLVDDLFSEKEESTIRRKTEIALEKSANTISELTSTLEDKVAETAEFEIKLSESEESVQSLEKELEAAQEELKTTKSLLEEKEQAIEDMIKTKVAGERMVELESAGVARAEKTNQLVKVKGMSDEEFTSYKEELVDIRLAVEAELKKATKDKKVEEDAKILEDEKKKAEELKAAEDAKNHDDGNTNTTPAKITQEQSTMAALNMESEPDKDLMTKYARLGETMAAEWKEKSIE